VAALAGRRHAGDDHGLSGRAHGGHLGARRELLLAGLRRSAQAYQIVDRQGIRVLRDPFTAKPFIKFYTTKRTGGGMVNFEAIKLMKFGWVCGNAARADGESAGLIGLDERAAFGRPALFLTIFRRIRHGCGTSTGRSGPHCSTALP
jgi:hypothetical protein